MSQADCLKYRRCSQSEREGLNSSFVCLSDPLLVGSTLRDARLELSELEDGFPGKSLKVGLLTLRSSPNTSFSFKNTRRCSLSTTLSDQGCWRLEIVTVNADLPYFGFPIWDPTVFSLIKTFFFFVFTRAPGCSWWSHLAHSAFGFFNSPTPHSKGGDPLSHGM